MVLTEEEDQIPTAIFSLHSEFSCEWMELWFFFVKIKKKKKRLLCALMNVGVRRK